MVLHARKYIPGYSYVTENIKTCRYDYSNKYNMIPNVTFTFVAFGWWAYHDIRYYCIGANNRWIFSKNDTISILRVYLLMRILYITLVHYIEIHVLHSFVIIIFNHRWRVHCRQTNILYNTRRNRLEYVA